MNDGRLTPRACWLVALLALLGVGLAQTGWAQAPPSPLKVTISFRNAPADVTFSPTDPAAKITIVVQVENISGAGIYTGEGFADSDFFRRLIFVRDSDGAIVTNKPEEQIYGHSRLYHCFSRQRVLARVATQVVPAQLLPGPPSPRFFREFVIDDARRPEFYNLHEPGRYRFRAVVPFHWFDPSNPAAFITDCDQFEGTPVVNVGLVAGRFETVLESNTLELVIASNDTIAPTTTASVSPLANAAGWNKSNVTVALTATDGPSGSGVKEIRYSINGSAPTVVPGASASVPFATEGVFTLTYFARDLAGNQEAPHTLTVKLDKTPPIVSGLPAPGCTLWPPNHKLVQVATVTATDALSGLVPGAPVVTGVSSEPETGTEPGDVGPDIVIAGGVVQLRAERAGSGPGRTYTLTATATDKAGNTKTVTATCLVPHNQ